MTWELFEGDCVEAMRAMPGASVDAVVCDPPYHLTFMGRAWDHAPTGAESQAMHLRWACEALRVLKPGGHLLAFGGTRTYHRLACAIEDAGFEIRDCLAWLYGSGFPKSLDVSKAIDKRAEENDETKRRIAAVAVVISEYRERAGMERAQVSEAVVGTPSGACWNWEHHQLPSVEMWPAIKATLDIPDDFDALIKGDRTQWIAAEREVLRRRAGFKAGRGGTSYALEGGWSSDLVDETAPATPDAERWQGWGTALKPSHEPVVMARKPLAGTVAQNVLEHGTGALNVDGCRIEGEVPQVTQGAEDRVYGGGNGLRSEPMLSNPHAAGRWPANVVLDEQAAEMLDEQTGERLGNASSQQTFQPATTGVIEGGWMRTTGGMGRGDSGGASRFLYVSKASTAERSAGLGGVQEGANRNSHPT